jgi:hypothetical protein
MRSAAPGSASSVNSKISFSRPVTPDNSGGSVPGGSCGPIWFTRSATNGQYATEKPSGHRSAPAAICQSIEATAASPSASRYCRRVSRNSRRTTKRSGRLSSPTSKLRRARRSFSSRPGRTSRSSGSVADTRSSNVPRAARARRSSSEATAARSSSARRSRATPVAVYGDRRM